LVIFLVLDRFGEFRRNEILSMLGSFIGNEKTALDVGCGSGEISAAISKGFGLRVKGIDLCVSKNSLIDFTLFDGKTIPFESNSFDIVFLFDVLHHVNGKPARDGLLFECFRVARKSVIIKDHYYSNFFQKQYLKLVDFATNFFPAVPTPFEFIKKSEWAEFNFCKIAYWRSMGVPNVLLKIKKEEGVKLFPCPQK